MLSGDVKATLPEDAAARKDIPIATGVLDYFPSALAYIAKISKAGNDKHNPGEPLHWARGKSMDHPDCIARHLADRGTVDGEDGLRHSGKLAWRALALLQEELEREEGAPLPRGAQGVATTAPHGDPRGPAFDGWLCSACGSTTVWKGIGSATARLMAAAYPGSWPTCDTPGCRGRMGRPQ